MNNTRIPLVDLYHARSRIHGRTLRTPLVRSRSLSDASGADVRLKLEHHQITGSFKLRGATNAILNLDREQRQKGTIKLQCSEIGLRFIVASVGLLALVAGFAMGI